MGLGGLGLPARRELIEHDLDLALGLANRVYVLDRGRLTYEGPAAPLANDLARRKEVLWV